MLIKIFWTLQNGLKKKSEWISQSYPLMSQHLSLQTFICAHHYLCHYVCVCMHFQKRLRLHKPHVADSVAFLPLLLRPPLHSENHNQEDSGSSGGGGAAAGQWGPVLKVGTACWPLWLESQRVALCRVSNPLGGRSH